VDACISSGLHLSIWSIAGARTIRVTPSRDAVRDAGYSGVILQYMLAAEVSGPVDAVRADAPCNAQHRPWRNQAAFRVGEFCALIHPNDDWFLHNDRGERLYTNWPGHTGYFYHMNPASPGVARFSECAFAAGAQR
jgi:hypothetical protein